MKSYTFTLTSAQVLGIPDLLNNYLFTAPVYGLNFEFPLTASGGHFTDTNYLIDKDCGLYFPYGYLLSTTYHGTTAAQLKGPHTIVFSPTALDTSYYAILKIIYDFGDGTMHISERGVGANAFGATDVTGNPANTNIVHTYWPGENNLTTFTPTITVINGNLSLDVYQLQFTLTQNSVLDFDKIRLINTAQHVVSVDETLGVFEIENPNYVTNVRFFSGGSTLYNENLAQKYVNLNDIPGLVLNLDASDTLSLTRDSQNRVYRWLDRSPLQNHFSQQAPQLAPSFINRAQSVANRNAVRFESTLSGDVVLTPRYMTCESISGFNSITAGSTCFFVIRTNSLSGTVFRGGTTTTNNPQIAFGPIPQNGISYIQGTSGVSIPNISLILPSYSLYTVTSYNQNKARFTIDNQSINFNNLQLSFESATSPATLSVPIIGTDGTRPAVDVEISQIVIYNRSLTDSEFSSIKNTLVNKWSIDLQAD